jgi:hypothetical protein
MKKKIIIIVILLVANLTVFAPPIPTLKPVNRTLAESGEHSESSPIGTATLLLLGLGAGFTGYKINKNKKEDKQQSK